MILGSAGGESGLLGPLPTSALRLALPSSFCSKESFQVLAWWSLERREAGERGPFVCFIDSTDIF